MLFGKNWENSDTSQAALNENNQNICSMEVTCVTMLHNFFNTDSERIYVNIYHVWYIELVNLDIEHATRLHIHIVYKAGLRIRIRIRRGQWTLIMEAWRLKMEPWRFHRSVVADSHHLDKSWIRIRIEVKSLIRIKVKRIRNPDIKTEEPLSLWLYSKSLNGRTCHNLCMALCNISYYT
jgi:hypothetical protein